MALSFLNVSQPNFYWRNTYEFVWNSTGLKILFTLSCTLSYTIGTFTTSALIHHEKFGEDPQKRSLVNQVKHSKIPKYLEATDVIFQLLTQMSKLTLVHYWTIYPLRIWQIVVGTVSYHAAYVWFYVGMTYLVAIGLTAFEIMLIRFFSIVIWKRMLPLLDDFFAMFFQCANLAVAAFLAIVSGCSEDFYPMVKITLEIPPFVPIMSKPENFKPM